MQMCASGEKENKPPHPPIHTPHANNKCSKKLAVCEIEKEKDHDSLSTYSCFFTYIFRVMEK